MILLIFVGNLSYVLHGFIKNSDVIYIHCKKHVNHKM